MGKQLNFLCQKWKLRAEAAIEYHCVDSRNDRSGPSNGASLKGLLVAYEDWALTKVPFMIAEIIDALSTKEKTA